MRLPFTILFGIAIGANLHCGGEAPPDASSGSGGSTSSGGGSPAEFCTTFCAATTCMAAAECQPTCLQTFAEAGPCLDLVKPLLACLTANAADFADCVVPSACDVPLGRYDACHDADCSGSNCDESETSCSCVGNCALGEAHQECDKAPNGTCTCSIDGKVVGTCQDETPSCVLGVGCCSQFFAPGL